MPEPREGESRKEFVGRCVPVVLDEGTTDDPKQAVAICHSYFDKTTKGDNVMGPNEKPKVLGSESMIAGEDTYREVADCEIPQGIKSKGWLSDDLDETLPISDKIKTQIAAGKRRLG